MEGEEKKYKAVVIGISAGGLETLKKFFSFLKKKFQLPIIVVQHIAPTHELGFITNYYTKISHYNVKEIQEKEEIQNGYIYFAPPNYHILIEDDFTFSLTVEEPVNFARPSIDVLFSSAANVYLSKLIGIMFTGANSDGTNGAKTIKANGGKVLVQDPEEALYPVMPQSVIDNVNVDEILSVKEIADFLNELQ